MIRDDSSITYLGLTNSRNRFIRFGIKEADRFSHVYIVGKTGTGKSTLLFNMARQDLAGGRGLCLIDPHGDLVERMNETALSCTRTDIMYWNVPDADSPYGYNPLRHVRADKRSLAVAGMLDAFKKLWNDAWGVRMEHILRNALYALLERPGSTLADILKLLDDTSFRKEAARVLVNETVHRFWEKEFPTYSIRYRSDGIAPIQNKVGAFLADPRLNKVLTKPEDDLHLRRIMDSGAVLLVNLAKGKIGEDSANLLGSLLVSTIGLAAFSRADVPPEERRPFFLYLDEFQSFTTLSVANMTSELRKYGVALTLAHQHLHQLEPEVHHAVLGNAGTLIAFRVGADDAPFLAREFDPPFTADDLVSLPNYHIYLRLMIDGEPSRPFSATTLNMNESN